VLQDSGVADNSICRPALIPGRHLKAGDAQGNRIVPGPVVKTLDDTDTIVTCARKTDLPARERMDRLEVSQ
jgi:hypothetical protein